MNETTAILLALATALVWSMVSHLDKFLVSHSSKNADKSIKGMMIFSTLVTGTVMAPICLALGGFNIRIAPHNMVISMLSGLAYAVATAFYLKAIRKNDASVVVTMLQLVPVLLFVSSIILYNEFFTARQLIGSVIIFVATIAIGFNLKCNRREGRLKAILLVVLSAIFYAVYHMLLDYCVRQENYYSCLTWYEIGLALSGVALICVKSYRKAFFNLIKRNGKRFVALNLVNELLNAAGVIFENIANVVLPIALVNIISGLQGCITFIIGAVGAIFLPKLFKEDLRKKVVIIKVICILLSIVGLILIFV